MPKRIRPRIAVFTNGESSRGFGRLRGNFLGESVGRRAEQDLAQPQLQDLAAIIAEPSLAEIGVRLVANVPAVVGQYSELPLKSPAIGQLVCNFCKIRADNPIDKSLL